MFPLIQAMAIVNVIEDAKEKQIDVIEDAVENKFPQKVDVIAGLHADATAETIQIILLL